MDIKYSYENNGETMVKLYINKQNYTIHGFSRAGLKTCILIDELNLAFDMGYANDKAFSYDNKLISHGHTDHIGALYNDHCARKMFNIYKERLYIMPKQCIKPFKIISSAISELNCGHNGDNFRIFENLHLTNIISAEDCNTNYISLISKGIHSEYVVKSILMDHKIKSYGYIIYRKSKKLKPEYSNLTTQEIVDLKKEMAKNNLNSIEINNLLTMVHYTPLVGYTGDTTINGVINNTELLNVPLLIMECTGFSVQDKEYTTIGKHIHIDDIADNHILFKNEKIILFHFSQQYKNLDDIIGLTNIPNELKDKIIYFF